MQQEEILFNNNSVNNYQYKNKINKYFKNWQPVTKRSKYFSRHHFIWIKSRIMLIFQQVNIFCDKPIFRQKQNKLIRFSHNTLTTISKNQALFVCSHNIIFKQSIQFPVVYNKAIDFQIYDKHDFDYNPQEFKQVMIGKIKLQRETNITESQIFQNNQRKIGTMTIKLRNSSVIPQKIRQIMPKNQKIIINSLIAHLPLLTHKQAYIAIKIGDIHKQTPIIRSNSGQIVFTQGWQIQKSSFIKNALIQIYSVQTKQNRIKMLAHGVLDLEQEYLQRRVQLKDYQKNEVGDLFVKGKIISRRMPKQQRINQLKPRYSTIDVGKLSRYKQPEMQKSFKPITIQRNQTSNSMQISKLSSPSNKNLLSASKISMSLSRIKKMTVVNKNNDIVFPKQQRFKKYQDKQSQYISYLTSRNNLLLKQKHSGKFYRGASIGYGDKTDFAKKGSPGVGKYKLPSIWDRY